MAKAFKRSYKFALFTAFFISVFATVFFGVFLFIYAEVEVVALVLFAAVFFVFSFLIIQLRIEHFIYKRVKEVYDNVSLLESANLQESPITSDMVTLTKEVKRFAEGKKLEIEALKIRENYRKEYMGNISHELKTPLFTVQAYILTLLDGAMHDKTLLEKYLRRTNKGVERLLYIVKDLDMITKLEVGELRLQIKVFDLVEVIKNVFDLLEMKATKKNISFDFQEEYTTPIWVKADPEQIQQVIINLMVNSIKYGQEGGTTEVYIEDITTDKIMLCITDNGEGIPQEQLPRIFERFYRVDKSGSRKEGGSGLGLSIVKHIIEAHDQKIYVESDYGIGSEFSFTLQKAEKPT
ncbi:sensor histidine kinase [Haloflavibacter putidus]|uniref:histidine kinase n=1 Tax=Haloflavibacter putidus TaxID=2576776 RepID=A0A507ZPZ2_9FLAO|nr:ATP-binding protein [Haloflavibacter putidus]TQD38573.1 sensor histidine kinase [Haloflavibacter putidus]